MNPDFTDTEKEILIRLRSGDERAFEEFYNIYSARIYRTITNMVKDREAAKELLQDVFIKVWEKRTTFDPENSCRSYLYTIVRNMVYNYMKRASLELQVQGEFSAGQELYNHVEEELAHKEIETILNSAISRLPPQRKKIFVLCKIEGKSYGEVSALLGISKGTINDHIVKATHFIKLELGDLNYTLSAAVLLSLMDV